MRGRVFYMAAAALFAAGAASADSRFSGEALPRFAAIRTESAGARVGPGSNFPLKYVYRSKFQPVQVINEYYGWYQVKDVSGDMSWLHKSYLTGASYVAPVVDGVLLYKKARPDSEALAKVGRGVVFLAEECGRDFCRVETNLDGVSYKGYLLRDSLFGI
jgi:SH3-like domain-containing protein